MGRTVDQLQEEILARTELPPLEPGKKVWNEGLTKDIKECGAHKYTIAGMSRLGPLQDEQWKAQRC